MPQYKFCDLQPHGSKGRLIYKVQGPAISDNVVFHIMTSSPTPGRSGTFSNSFFLREGMFQWLNYYVVLIVIVPTHVAGAGNFILTTSVFIKG